ncbi:hypothetical protein POTOM_061977 [Populus tomentosa]|uniref:Late embryogenesis abundant protein LEA-2 subgroup domain-containing protein n=1 Tax=Populus tomentosa TaxID=118781 RepID=A0A8X7XLX2_POPTO|nr:hypothetical protein POTOM_061977 [Populus tomentosa]
MDFRSLDVAVKYRGKRLGHVRSDHGHVRALGSSYVNAEVDFSGISVLSDVVSLLDDLARGTVPFDTVTDVSGRLGLLFFGFPLKGQLLNIFDTRIHIYGAQEPCTYTTAAITG